MVCRYRTESIKVFISGTTAHHNNNGMPQLFKEQLGHVLDLACYERP